MRHWKVWAGVLVAAVIAFAVLASVRTSPTAKGPIVLAASSVQEAMEDAAQAWAAKGHPEPVLSFAATSALARQVEAGAAADLFVSADAEWMDKLDKAGLLQPGSRADFLSNTLVVVAARDNPVALDLRPGVDLAGALGTGRLALADPESVPAGKYAKAALTALGAWPQVEQRVAAAENVRAALALVERGQAPLGVVYATDARASDKVRIVGEFPASSHPPIVYPLAVLARSSSPDAAGFRAFLLSAEGKAIFARHGFGP
jgi:molybdate transport system substrate-binding protein